MGIGFGSVTKFGCIFSLADELFAMKICKYLPWPQSGTFPPGIKVVQFGKLIPFADDDDVEPSDFEWKTTVAIEEAITAEIQDRIHHHLAGAWSVVTVRVGATTWSDGVMGIVIQCHIKPT